MVSALYPGSFDPVTRGHLDLVERALPLFDHLTVAVARNSSKSATFTPEERVAMLREVLPKDPRVSVTTFRGLVVDFCRTQGIGAILRGVRTVSDFEYEYQMALMNRHLSSDQETVFMVPSLDTTYISASLVREVARFGGKLEGLVHPSVAEALRQKFETR